MSVVESGKKCLELSRHKPPINLLEKILLEKSWYSSRCFLMWRIKETKKNRLIFQLIPTPQKSMNLSIKKSDPVLWNTPEAHPRTHSPRNLSSKGHYPLANQVGGVLNPNWVEWLMGYPIGWTDV